MTEMMLTLRTRLAVGSTAVFGVLLTGLSLVSYQQLAGRLNDDVTERLTQLTAGLHGYLRVGEVAASVEFDANDSDEAMFVHEATRYYQIYDVATGRLLAASNAMTPMGLHFTPDEVETYRAHPVTFDIQTQYGRIRVSNSVSTEANGRGYLLQVGVSLATLDAALTRYRALLWWRVPAGLLLALVGAWWLSGFALRPLAHMSDVAGKIDINTLTERVPVRGVADELDRVGLAFNDTLARLEHAVGEMRQFSAALAHELRTPLAALRGEIELSLRAATSDAQRQVLGSQIEEIDRLTRLIDHILTLARAEGGQIRLNFVPVNLSDLAASLVSQLEPIADAQSITLRCEAPEPVTVHGDPGWLQRLLLNLLDNALKFTHEHGRVVVRTWRDGHTARIDVEDTGPGLSPEDASHMFERFFRADQSRSSSTPGAGLGLSLVQWIVAQHHGTISVESRLGEGTTFAVTLPLAPRDMSES